MSHPSPHPVLIIGGSGIVGSKAARALRELHPEQPIAIGGRNLEKAASVAGELGNATAVAVDLDQPGLGLSTQNQFSAVVLFVKDEHLHYIPFAQASGIPYLSISSGLTELGPEVAHYISRPNDSAIVLGSEWLVGIAALPVLHYGKEFRRLEQIAMTAVLDSEDIGGPAAHADFERLTTAGGPTAMIRQDGRWRWVTENDQAMRRMTTDITGQPLEVEAYAPFDVLSLAARTGAATVRFDLAVGATASRRRGEPFSSETIVELSGEDLQGRPAALRVDLVHPEGQAPVTALNVALTVERLLGLNGQAPVTPGLYMPDQLLDPAYAMQRWREFGIQIRVSAPEAAAAEA
ncbi:MAG: hypothetical protein LAT50_04775 [Ectothiorhodospiraceae bacterium]|nr:hypothetical protein [Ectothiorhodospiraceae bacterium]